MLKSIAQLVQESEDPIIKDLTNTSGAIICDDCMHGNHEILGHATCECACHGNPQCLVCGRCLLLVEDRREGIHSLECQDAYDEQEANRMPNEPFGRYPWER